MNASTVERHCKLWHSIRQFFAKKPDRVSPRNEQQYFVISIMTYMGLVTHVALIPIFWMLGVELLVIINCFSVVFWILSIVSNRMGCHFIAATTAVSEVLLHQILCVIIIGWGAGFQYHILFVPTAVFLLPHGQNGFKISLLFISTSTFFLLDLFLRTSAPLTALTDFTLSAFNYYNAFVFISVISFITYYTNAKRHEAERTLKEEHQKSERLLLNILPASIAERLKTGSEIIADRFDSVSILFLDIVQFTEKSDKISAPKVVAFLNRLFLIFDDLTEHYGLEKIKTIGDAYMVAAGIPDPCNDHAERLADMSLDIKKALNDFNKLNSETVRLRIGIHSGPAVAGVIGKKKFAYDIWGDTVNTASRMEAYGEPGEIHVSEATYRLLRGKYDFEPRGIIGIKGKGDLQTYFLKSHHHKAASVH